MVQSSEGTAPQAPPDEGSHTREEDMMLVAVYRFLLTRRAQRLGQRDNACPDDVRLRQLDREDQGGTP